MILISSRYVSTSPWWLPLIFALNRRKRCPSSSRQGCSPCLKTIASRSIAMLSSVLYFSLTSSRKAAHSAYISNRWLGPSTPSRRYRVAQCLPCLHRNPSEGDRSQILCQCPYLVVQYEFSNYQCGFVDNPDDEGGVQDSRPGNFYHQLEAYLSFDSSLPSSIIFVSREKASRNSASPSLSAARKAHPRAKIVVGSPMPLPTTVSIWKGCLVALRRNKMPQVAVKNGRRNFISKRLRDFCRRRMYFSCRQSCYWPFFHFLNAGTAYIST